MSLRPMIGAFALALAVGACASGGSSSAPAAGAATSTAVRRGGANMITESEIAALTGVETVYDVIQRLRPNMLRTRGSAGEASAGAAASTIKVYLNGTPYGDVAMLRSIQASSIKQVEYLSAADATTRFGTGLDAGAILVTSK